MARLTLEDWSMIATGVVVVASFVAALLGFLEVAIYGFLIGLSMFFGTILIIGASGAK